jgi:hypothetical protein
MSADTVEELYGQLAERRFRQAAGTLEHALGEPGRAEGLVGEMAVALEDAAAVIAVLAARCGALAHVRGEIDGQAVALVALAGRLEQAADLGRL